MADVVTTKDIFYKLLKIADQKNICETDILLNLFGTLKMNKQRKAHKLQMISDAIQLDCELRLLYVGSESGTILRRILPKKLIGKGRQAVVEGFCHLRGEDRAFYVDKIINIRSE